MALVFDLGSPNSPKGHALLYFEDSAQPGRWLSTYMVVLPVRVDISKYLPPMFLSQAQMGSLDIQDMSAFAFPPVPESVDSRDWLERIASLRGDDLINGGPLSSQDMQRSMMAINEFVQEYARLCQRYQDAASPVDEPLPPAELSVSHFMYEFMTPNERLEELSKLIGKLQFAVAGPDAQMAEETKAELQAIASHFAEHFWMDRLLDAAGSSDDRDRRLAQLYLDRCYRLVDEDYLKAKQIEEEILRLGS